MNRKRKIATVIVYVIIISAFVLLAAGLLGFVPKSPTGEIVAVLAFAGFIGVVALDASKPKIPQFPDDWKEHVE